MANDVRAIIHTPNEVSKLASETIEERRANPDAGIRAPVEVLNKHLHPCRPGELVEVLARTTNYKSGFMQAWARDVAQTILDEDADDEIVAYVTWETSVEELGLFDLANKTGLNAGEVNQGWVDDMQWAQMQKAAVKRSTSPIWIIGHSISRRKRRPRMTMSDVADAMMLIEDEWGVKFRAVFLDYLQRMEAEEGYDRRTQVMTNINRCKDMALHLGCPVIVGVQAARRVDKREWKLPTMRDCEETSSIEQAADKMVSLWYPITSEDEGDYLKDAGLTVTPNLLIAGVQKQKFGPSGMWVPLYVDPARNKIGTMDTRTVDLNREAQKTNEPEEPDDEAVVKAKQTDIPF